MDSRAWLSSQGRVSSVVVESGGVSSAQGEALGTNA